MSLGSPQNTESGFPGNQGTMTYSQPIITENNATSIDQQEYTSMQQ